MSTNTSLSSWRDWYNSNQNYEYQVRPIHIDEMQGWSNKELDVDGQSLRVLYRDGAPYVIQAIEITPPGREPYALPMPRRYPDEIAMGYVAVPVDRHSDRIILQVKQEAGFVPDINHTVTGPGVQMSQYNYQKFKPLRSEWVPLIKTWYPIPQDGGMLLGKYNKVGFLELDIDGIILHSHERVFTMVEVAEVIEAGLCPDHVLQALGMLKVFRG